MLCRRALPPLLLVLFACRPDPGEVDLVRLLPTAELRTETAEIEVGTPAGRLRLHEGFGRDERAPGPAGGEAGGWVWALGERSPLVVGMTLPSGVIRRHQPRYFTSLVNEPVRQSVTHRFPSRSNFEPKAYSW